MYCTCGHLLATNTLLLLSFARYLNVSDGMLSGPVPTSIRNLTAIT